MPSEGWPKRRRRVKQLAVFSFQGMSIIPAGLSLAIDLWIAVLLATKLDKNKYVVMINTHF
jgi:hypothetical protein